MKITAVGPEGVIGPGEIKSLPIGLYPLLHGQNHVIDLKIDRSKLEALQINNIWIAATGHHVYRVFIRGLKGYLACKILAP